MSSAVVKQHNSINGYKQTELGLIPEDWEVKAIGSIFDIAAGGDLVTEDYSPDFGAPHVYPIYSNALTNKGLYGYSKNYRYDAYRITVTARGGIGHAEYRDKRFCAIGRLLVLSASSDCDLRYVTEYLNNFVEFALESTGVPQLTAPQISKYSIALPPTKTEQEAIAEALSDADALIESLEQLIAKKRQIKQGVMQDLLTGKKRLADFNDAWAEVSLGNIADKNKQWSFTGGPFGSNLKSSDYTNDGVRIIQLQNIGDGEFINDEFVYTSELKANELISCNIYPDDIILSKMGDPVARACIIPPLYSRYLMCSDGIRLAVNRDEFDNKFVYYAINFEDFRTAANNASTGSTRKRIGLTELRELKINCPKLPEQAAIASIISAMDAEIEALESKLAKTKQVKQGMMQDLLTGKVRLV